MNQYIYIGQYYHKHGLDLQELGITEKKIGLTKDLNDREKALNSTKMTIGYVVAAAWKVDDMRKVESALHNILAHDRLDGEWFTDREGDLIQRVDKHIATLELGTRVGLNINSEVDKGAQIVIESASKNQIDVENTFSDNIHAGAFFLELKDKIETLGYRLHMPPSGAYLAIRKGKSGNILGLNTKKDGMYIDSTELPLDTEDLDMFDGWNGKHSRAKFFKTTVNNESDVDKYINILNEQYEKNKS